MEYLRLLSGSDADLAIAGTAGTFDMLAYQAAPTAGGSSLRLYLAIFAVGIGITTFLSNGATALILTPVTNALETRLRLPVLPLMFACTFITDTALFLLPVSSPINILVLNTFEADLGTFLYYLVLPALVGDVDYLALVHVIGAQPRHGVEAQRGLLRRISPDRRWEIALAEEATCRVTLSEAESAAHPWQADKHHHRDTTGTRQTRRDYHWPGA